MESFAVVSAAVELVVEPGVAVAVAELGVGSDAAAELDVVAVVVEVAGLDLAGLLLGLAVVRVGLVVDLQAGLDLVEPT